MNKIKLSNWVPICIGVFALLLFVSLFLVNEIQWKRMIWVLGFFASNSLLLQYFIGKNKLKEKNNGKNAIEKEIARVLHEKSLKNKNGS